MSQPLPFLSLIIITVCSVLTLVTKEGKHFLHYMNDSIQIKILVSRIIGSDSLRIVERLVKL